MSNKELIRKHLENNDNGLAKLDGLLNNLNRLKRIDVDYNGIYNQGITYRSLNLSLVIIVVVVLIIYCCAKYVAPRNYFDVWNRIRRTRQVPPEKAVAMEEAQEHPRRNRFS